MAKNKNDTDVRSGLINTCHPIDQDYKDKIKKLEFEILTYKSLSNVLGKELEEYKGMLKSCKKGNKELAESLSNLKSEYSTLYGVYSDVNIRLDEILKKVNRL